MRLPPKPCKTLSHHHPARGQGPGYRAGRITETKTEIPVGRPIPDVAVYGFFDVCGCIFLLRMNSIDVSTAGEP
jgi:hypothetical protein